jgi:hypothetical protein
MDEVTKLLKSLYARMEKIELEGKEGYRNSQNTKNRDSFKILNNAPQIIQIDQRNRDKDDQKIKTPLQNNLATNEDEDEEEEDIDFEIHFLGDTSSSPHLNQSAYEDALTSDQLNELSKGERIDNNPNRYNLRSKKK